MFRIQCVLRNILSPFLVIDEYDVASHREYMLSDVGSVQSYNQDWGFVGLHVCGYGMGYYVRRWNLI